MMIHTYERAWVSRLVFLLAFLAVGMFAGCADAERGDEWGEEATDRYYDFVRGSVHLFSSTRGWRAAPG